MRKQKQGGVQQDKRARMKKDKRLEVEIKRQMIQGTRNITAETSKRRRTNRGDEVGTERIEEN